MHARREATVSTMINPAITIPFPVAELAERLLEHMNGHLVQPRLLDAKQAGKYMGRSEQMIRKMYRDGVIRSCSHDGKLLFDRLELDQVIEGWKNA